MGGVAQAHVSEKACTGVTCRWSGVVEYRMEAILGFSGECLGIKGEGIRRISGADRADGASTLGEQSRMGKYEYIMAAPVDNSRVGMQ
jgi:hypothetical protein